MYQANNETDFECEHTQKEGKKKDSTIITKIKEKEHRVEYKEKGSKWKKEKKNKYQRPYFFAQKLICG